MRITPLWPPAFSAGFPRAATRSAHEGTRIRAMYAVCARPQYRLKHLLTPGGSRRALAGAHLQPAYDDRYRRRRYRASMLQALLQRTSRSVVAHPMRTDAVVAVALTCVSVVQIADVVPGDWQPVDDRALLLTVAATLPVAFR